MNNKNEPNNVEGNPNAGKPGPKKNAFFRIVGWLLKHFHHIFELALAVLISIFTYHANVISGHSNKLIDRQILIEDASRRTTYSEEISSILDQINTYHLSGDSNTERAPLPQTIIARIKVASEMMQPYKSPLSESTHFAIDSLSQERGRLLATLVTLKPSNLRYFLHKCDFTYSEITQGIAFVRSELNSRFDHSSFSNLELISDTIPNASFVGCHFRKVSFMGNNLSNSDFTSAVFFGGSISSSSFANCIFRNAWIYHVNIDTTRGGRPNFDGADFTNAKVDRSFYDTVIDSLPERPFGIEIICP